jgi:hypothetical protein
MVKTQTIYVLPQNLKMTILMIKQLKNLICQKLILFIRYSTKKNRFTTKNITFYQKFVLKLLWYNRYFLCLNDILSKFFKVFRKKREKFLVEKREFFVERPKIFVLKPFFSSQAHFGHEWFGL